MEAQTNDAKQTAPSSEAAVTAAPSTATEAAATAPEVSPASTKEPSLAEVAQQAYDESTKSLETEVGKEGQGQELAPTEEAKTEEASTEKPVVENPDEDLPFHRHPRFQELIAQKNEYEKKFKEIEPKLKEVEPRLKWMDTHNEFIQRFGITDGEFANAMNLLAMQKSDPGKFVEALKPLFEQAKVQAEVSVLERDPNYIPPDLEARIKEGEISEAAAHEIAAARVTQRKLATHEQSQRQQQMTWQQKQQEAQQSAIYSWDQSHRTSDPDFKPKSNPSEPDGLWEMTAAKFAYLQTSKFANNPQEIVAHLDSAYRDSKALLNRFAKAMPSTKPQVTTTKSSTTSRKREEDMTLHEVVQATAAKFGIHWNPSTDKE